MPSPHYLPLNFRQMFLGQSHSDFLNSCPSFLCRPPSNNEATNRRRRRTNILMASITSSFFFFWTPSVLYNYVHEFHRELLPQR